jgi:prepilin-type N-terminal cleavage/methylation domain-containing protein
VFNKSQSGFSLLELVIALTILATLTIFSSSSIQQALKSRTKIQEQIDEMSMVRDALRIIEKDIQLAFHYQDLELEFNQNIRRQGGAQVKTRGPNDPPEPPPPPAVQNPTFNDPQSGTKTTTDPFKEITDISRDPSRINPVTHFIGDESELNFVTMNSSMMVAGAQQADFIEVGYRLTTCQKPGGGGSSSCIVRRMSPFVDVDVKKGGNDNVLLEGVTEFKLRYIGKGKQDWISQWNSKEGSDTSIIRKFPELVEVSITVDKTEGEKKKKISMQLVVPIRNPNNAEPQVIGGSNNSNSQNPNQNFNSPGSGGARGQGRGGDR